MSYKHKNSKSRLLKYNNVMSTFGGKEREFQTLMSKSLRKLLAT